jgi:chromosome segregation ATPase
MVVNSIAGLAPLLGIFGKPSPRQQRARLQDIALTLKQKERELLETEKAIEELQNKASAAEALNNRIREQQQALASLEGEAEQKLREFGRAEKEFRARETAVLEAEQALKEQEAVLEEKRSLLAEKEDALRSREGLVEERKQRAEQIERAIRHSEAPLERRRKRLAKEIEEEERRLIELKAVIEQQKLEQAVLSRQISQSKKQLSSFNETASEIDNARTTVEKRAIALAEREKKLREQAGRIRKYLAEFSRAKQILEQSAIIKTEAERAVKEKESVRDEAKRLLEQNSQRLAELRTAEHRLLGLQKELTRRQKEVNARLQEIEQKEKEISVQAALVSLMPKAKEELASEAMRYRKDLARLKEEWTNTIGALNDAKEFLSSQKTSIRQLAKSDIGALKEKEQELLGLVKDLEADRRRLEQEERAVVARVRQLERAQREVEQKRNDVRIREQRLVEQEKTAKKILMAAEKARQLKADVPKLSREAGQLRREVAILKATGARYGARPQVLEGTPVFAEAIKQGRRRVKAEKSGKPVSAGKDELDTLIEGARASLQAGDIESAQKILDDLETAAKKMKEDERRQLSYEIRDLRTSIKLASLMQ